MTASPSPGVRPGLPQPGSVRCASLYGLPLGREGMDSDLQAWQRVGGAHGRRRGAIRECTGNQLWD